MSKKMIVECVIAVLIVAALGTVLYFVLGDPAVDTSQITGVSARGVNRETGQSVEASLRDADAEKVLKIFEGKKKSASSPGDVFGEKCAFILTDGDTQYHYFLAADGSGFLCSANDDMYFSVSQEERSVLVGILEDYCGYRES